MSIPVSAVDLGAALSEREPGAYVLTVSDDDRPHAVYAVTGWEHGRLTVAVGARTSANAGGRPQVSLLFPVRNESDYSLIVDGVASVEETPEGPRLWLTPTRAVLHRPGTPATATATACGSDCVRLETAGAEATPSPSGRR